MRESSSFPARALAALLVIAPASALAGPPEAPPPEVATTAGAPTLARVITLARERAPMVAAAREDVALGRAEGVGARLPPITNPYVEVTVNRGNLGATKDVAVNGQLWFPVEISGQRGKRVAEFEALVALRESQLDTTKAVAMGDAARAYGAAAVAGARVRTWERLVTVARDEAEIYAQRLAAGDTTEPDAKLARVELARNAVTLAEARADLIRAMAEIFRLTGARFTDAPASAEPPDHDGAASGPKPRAGSAGLDHDGSASGPKPSDHPPSAEKAPAVRALESEAAYQVRVRDRSAREAHTPLNLILNLGRGDLGETRVGGGLSWSLPIARTGQGEVARADAARARALSLRDVTARSIAAAVAGLTAEREQVRRAREEITSNAEPLARAAVDAAVARQRAGKGDLLPVLTARRDLALLEARRLDFLQREWNIVSDIIALTGELP